MAPYSTLTKRISPNNPVILRLKRRTEARAEMLRDLKFHQDQLEFEVLLFNRGKEVVLKDLVYPILSDLVDKSCSFGKGKTLPQFDCLNIPFKDESNIQGTAHFSIDELAPNVHLLAQCKMLLQTQP